MATRATADPAPGRLDLPIFGTRALICGLAGRRLSGFERDYLRTVRPWGVILFARNVASPNQVRELTAGVRDELGWHAPILVDQEGGRVQRLKPPHWRRYPSAGRFGAMEVAAEGRGVEAAQIAAWMIADDLLSVGIDVNCAPVLDLRLPGSTNAIGNRAYHGLPEVVIKLARAVHDAYLESGVVPVIKHMPGHGRARDDSHMRLPRIRATKSTLALTDFSPFRALQDAPMGMTGHLLFDAIDSETPATLSKPVIDYVRHTMKFNGLLLTDDLSMGALSGSINERAKAAIAAGCDIVLHCNGSQSEMDAIVESVPELTGTSAERAARALARRGRQSIDRAALDSRLEALLADFSGSDDDGIVDPTKTTHA